MRKLTKIIAGFATKQKDFFWNDINPTLVQAQYAVRGVVPTLANTIKEQIQNGDKSFPFDQVTFCNIGNPQEFRQQPITFFRQVLACVTDPYLIKNESLNKDARIRAQKLLKEIISIGSYTHSLGIPSIRKNVAKFIAKEDSVPEPPIENIFLTEGASQGVHLLFKALIMDINDAVMIPIPQYPLYSAALSLYGGSLAPYYLDESLGWQLDLAELERSLQQSKANGKKVKAIVVINPGNPTGAIFNSETIHKILEFSVKHNLVLIADEVYRENIYKEGASFISFRKVLETMSQDIKDQCELASLHSCSKGLLGECGMRAGYLYLHNFNPEVVNQIVKLKSINLCSGAPGQVIMDLMVNPPINDVTPSTKEKYLSEIHFILESLKYRAKIVTKYLNEMVNVKCNQVEGAMYAFPTITFSEKAQEAAKKEGQSPDLFYCLEVLKNTGIALVPGSGFQQKPGTYHFRITTLILPEGLLQKKLQELKKFNDAFHAKYA